MQNFQFTTPGNRMQDLQRNAAIYNFLISFAESAPQKIGYVITYPVLFPIRCLTLYKARKLYRQISKDRKKLYSIVSDMNDSQIMDAHIIYENYKIDIVPGLRSLINKLKSAFSNSFVVGYIVSYLNACIELIENTELDLRSAAYPDIDRQLTPDQIDELFDAFKGKETSEWDEKDNSYQKLYLS